MRLLLLISQAFILMLPAIAANSSPIFLAHFRLFETLNRPIHKKVLGKNKTWRGLLIGTLIGITVSALLYIIDVNTRLPALWISFEYEIRGLGATLLLGFLQGIGILGFDMLKSFLKRRLDRPAGSPWIPFDELDFLGAVLLMLLIHIPETTLFIFILIAAPITHSLSNLIAFKAKFKKVPW